MPSLDSLRGLAILLVLIFHAYGGYSWASAGPQWSPVLKATVGEATFGVHLFFLLSGFLIGGILLRASGKKSYYRDFYIKRALRILPVYLVVLVVLKIWEPISWRFLTAAVLFMANFSMLLKAPLHQYGSLWSLAVEEHFYLLWPTCVRRFSTGTLAKILIAILITEPILRVIAIRISPNIDIRFKTCFVLDYIAYGALIAVFTHTRKLSTGNALRIGSWLLGIGGFLALFTIWLSAFHPSYTLVALRGVPWMWLCSGILLLGLRYDADRTPTRTAHRSWGVLPFFGYISYGLYLINVFVNQKVGAVVDRFMRPAAQSTFGGLTIKAILCIGVAVFIAYLSRRFFEEPCLRLKDALTGHGSKEPNAENIPDLTSAETQRKAS